MAIAIKRHLSDITIVAGVLIILGILIIPLPSFMLDFAISLSFSLALLILFIAIYISKPLEFSTFPSLLLIVTIFRLSLNVATTRAILLHGAQTPAAAGHIIQSFGKTVVGGNFIVGIIVFSILVIINFIVVTKGATRIAEVTARFTLDAMPGKQMSIDADLNSGLIDEAGARARREEISRESDFYGAMDGASKFVRGDAVAGLLIISINIMGGIIIGLAQYGMTISAATSRFTLLTVGDGLVSQIPALIISSAAGLIISRTASSKESLPSGLVNQLMGHSKSLLTSAAILFALSLVPGLPTVPLLSFAAILAFSAYIKNKNEKKAVKESELGKQKKKEPEKEENITDLLKVDPLALEVGYGLIALVNPDEGGNLLDKIKGIRRQLALEIGIIVPPIRIRDNLEFGKNEYVFMINGSEVNRYTVLPDKLLAMGGIGKLDNAILTHEPSFKLEAYWVDPSNQQDALKHGYTVVDPSTVIATHISEIIKNSSADLLTREGTQQLLDVLKKQYPKVTEELFKTLSLGIVQKVLKNLLRSGIPIRNMLIISETLADFSSYTKEPDLLTEQARAALSRIITDRFKEQDGKLHTVFISPAVNKTIEDNITGTKKLYLLLPSDESDKLVKKVAEVLDKSAQNGSDAVLVVNPKARQPLEDFLRRSIKNIHVLSFAEISDSASIESAGIIE